MKCRRLSMDVKITSSLKTSHALGRNKVRCPKKRASMVIGQLKEQALGTKKRNFHQKTSKPGLMTLIEEINRKFGSKYITMLHNSLLNVSDFVWENGMSAAELVVRFHSRLDEISKLDMNDEVKGHSLLRQANVDDKDQIS